MPSRFFFPLRHRGAHHPHHAHEHHDEDTASGRDNFARVGDHSGPIFHLPTGPGRGVPMVTSSTHNAHPRAHRRHQHYGHREESCVSHSRPAYQNFHLRTIDQDHDECVVCSSTFEPGCVVSLLPCGHYFCSDCVSRWVNNSHMSTCPLCRYDLAEQRSSSEEEDEPLSTEYFVQVSGKNLHEDLEEYAQKMEILLSDLHCSLSLAGQPLDPVSAGGTSSCISAITSHRGKAFGDNFDLIMAKTLHARRARMAAVSSSRGSSSFSSASGES